MELWEGIINFIKAYPPYARIFALAGLAITITTFIFVPKDEIVVGERKSSFKIDNPIDKSTVSQSFPVTGRLESLPRDHELWIIATDTWKDRYWIQGRVAVRQEEKTWSGNVNHIGNPGEIRTFGLFLVGPDGQALFNLYQRASENIKELNRKLNLQDSNNLSMVTITELTNDTYPVDELTVTVK